MRLPSPATLAAAAHPQRLRRLIGQQAVAPLAGDRPTSFPFVSGDTFRSLAQLIVETHPNPVGSPRVVQRRRGVPAAERPLLFLSGSVLEPGTAGGVPDAPPVVGIVDYVRHLTGLDSLADWRVVIHNGDLVPGDPDLIALAAASRGVACVNAPDGLPGVTPVPIGLENLWWRGNGMLGDFVDPPDPNARRDVELVASFRVGTNPAARAPLAEAVAQSRHQPVGFARTPAEFHQLLRRTQFVLSPPGNGADCHRTWEALYLGAVPVLQRGTLPESLTAGLPILVVDRWQEVLDLSPPDAAALFHEVRQRPAHRAYMPHWVGRLLS